jgi:hypothetical protein
MACSDGLNNCDDGCECCAFDASEFLKGWGDQLIELMSVKSPYRLTLQLPASSVDIPGLQFTTDISVFDFVNIMAEYFHVETDFVQGEED